MTRIGWQDCLLQRHGVRDGAQALWFWRDEWHRWDGAAYRTVSSTEIRAEVTRLTKQEFDAENLNQLRTEDDDQPATCRKVTTGLVNNILHALQSLCLLPGHRDQPVWLCEEEPFPVNDVLATKSGIIHIPSLITGVPSLLPTTPLLFNANALPYSFDPNAECPEWMTFPDSIWADDPQAIDTLAEWFGYFLSTTNHEGDELDFHALRHTCGAWLATSGVHPKVVQTVMRHSTITLTMDTYGHLFPGHEADAVTKLPAMFSSAQKELSATGTDDAQGVTSTKLPADRQHQRGGSRRDAAGREGDESPRNDDDACRKVLPMNTLDDKRQDAAERGGTRRKCPPLDLNQ